MTTPRQPGWYDGPDDSTAVSYWDGQGWTPHRQPKPFSRKAPLPVAPTPPPPADHELGPGQVLPPPPWYRRHRILIAAAFAALIAELGITVSGPGDPGTAPGGTTGTSTPWSASFSLISTGWWTPDPTEPPAEHQTAPPAAAPRMVPPRAVAPPPPPSELVFRREPLTAIVSITNNANKPAVGCVYRSVAVAGQATIIHYDHSVNFTVTGSAEARVQVGNGPATGSTFHVTVTCDNGLSTSQDVVY
ncbi:MAG: hypothetical protein QOG19_3495 [Mycobacterium sp.]|nr:hypothetical protein [Mycobacterium sp.]